MPITYIPLEQQDVRGGPEGLLGGIKRGILPWMGYPQNQPFFSGGTLGYALGEQALYSGVMRYAPMLLARLGVTALTPQISIPLQVLTLAALGAKAAIGHPPETWAQNIAFGAAIPMVGPALRKAWRLTPRGKAAAAAAKAMEEKAEKEAQQLRKAAEEKVAAATRAKAAAEKAEAERAAVEKAVAGLPLWAQSPPEQLALPGMKPPRLIIRPTEEAVPRRFEQLGLPGIAPEQMTLGFPGEAPSWLRPIPPAGGMTGIVPGTPAQIPPVSLAFPPALPSPFPGLRALPPGPPQPPPASLWARLQAERARINELATMRERIQAMAARPGKERKVGRALRWIDREMDRHFANVRRLNAAYEAGLRSVPEPAALKVVEATEGIDLAKILRSGGVTLDELQVTNLRAVQKVRERLAGVFVAENGVTPETAEAMADRLLARLAEGKDRKAVVAAIKRAAQGLRQAEDGPDVRLVLMRAFGEVAAPEGAARAAGRSGGRQFAAAKLATEELAALKAAEASLSGITIGDLANALRENAIDLRDVARMLARYSDIRGAVLGRVGQNVNGELVPPLTQFLRAMLRDVSEGDLGRWANLDVQNVRPLLAEYIKTRAPSKLISSLSRQNTEEHLAEALGVPLETLRKTTSKLSDDVVKGALSVYETSLEAGAPPGFARDLAAQALGVRNLSRLLFPSVEDAAQELAWAKAAAAGSPGPVLARAIAKRMGVDWLDVYAFADDAAIGIFNVDDILLVMASRLNLPTDSILDKAARASLGSLYAKARKFMPPDPYAESIVREAVKSRLTPGIVTEEALKSIGKNKNDIAWGRTTGVRRVTSGIFSTEAGEKTFVPPLIEEIVPRGAMTPFEQTEAFPAYVEVVKKLEALPEPVRAASRGQDISRTLIQEMDETFFGDWIEDPRRDPRTAKRLKPVIAAINRVLDDEALSPDQKYSKVLRIVRGFRAFVRSKVASEKPIAEEGIPGMRIELEPSKVKTRRTKTGPKRIVL